MNADALYVIACPTCLGRLAAAAGHAGRTGCCPLCAATFLLPVISSAASIATPPHGGHKAIDEPVEPVARPQPDPFADLVAAAATGQTEAAPSPSSPLVFHDPVRRVGDGDHTVELRRLTDEERRARRARRNILLLIAGAAVLIAITVAFGYKPGR
jgi:hypothetical protein